MLLLLLVSRWDELASRSFVPPMVPLIEKKATKLAIMEKVLAWRRAQNKAPSSANGNPSKRGAAGNGGHKDAQPLGWFSKLFRGMLRRQGE